MITYDWKAGFSQEELKTIERYKKLRAKGNIGQIAIVLSRMAEALDVRDAILNELDKTETLAK